MDVSARLRDFSVVLLVAFGLLVSAPRARADDEFVLNRNLPTLRSLAARAQQQTAAPAATATAGPICDIFANGYDPTGATPCAGCFDGTLNYTETDIDCGGIYCKACADGKHCAVGSDCRSTVCNTSTTVCAPATCADGILDGTETDVDCGGGTCPPCAVGKKCFINGDCTTGACDFVSGVCVSSLCFDQRKDGLETDVDCGGGVCSACGVGKSCLANADCTSNACDAISLTCVSNQCFDNRKDGLETDVDCGGANACARCAVGKSCIVNSDCQAGHTCSAGSPHVCQ